MGRSGLRKQQFGPPRLDGLLFALLGAAVVLFSGCTDAGAGGRASSPVAHVGGVALDASAIAGWASEVVSYEPGPEATSYTDPSEAIGPASGVSTEVLVLGRGGSVTLAFEAPIADAEGAELAVFENGLGTVEELFAELAYVGISSNGRDFARFAVRSSRTEPVSAYGRINPAEYSGFAGLHPGGVGTAFDFGELAENPRVTGGEVDLESIRYVRIVDLVGDGSETDDEGNPVYDPYPTSGSAGFDLDGVAFLRGGP
jgi:hypothetical protein